MRRRRLAGALILAFGVISLTVLWLLVGRTPEQKTIDRIRTEFSKPSPNHEVLDREFAKLREGRYDLMSKLLGDESEAVSSHTLDYLRHLNDSEAERVLIGAMESSARGWAIAKVLGARRARGAVPQIVEAIRGSTPGDVLRPDAALALGQIGDERGIAGLEVILSSPKPHPPTWRKQSSIIENTARVRATGALFRLDPKNMLAEDSFLDFPAYYESAFGNIRPVVVAECADIPLKEADDLIGQGLRDADPEVRCAAIRAYAKRNPSDHFKVIEPFRSDAEPIVRAAAESVLGAPQKQVPGRSQ